LCVFHAAFDSGPHGVSLGEGYWYPPTDVSEEPGERARDERSPEKFYLDDGAGDGDKSLKLLQIIFREDDRPFIALHFRLRSRRGRYAERGSKCTILTVSRHSLMDLEELGGDLKG